MSDKEEKRPRLEKMVDASEYKKKENSLTRALSVFLPEDVYDLKDYIINGIVVPMIKDGLEDIGHTYLVMVTGIVCNKSFRKRMISCDKTIKKFRMISKN